jgi:LEA14-like dessication related protein
MATAVVAGAGCASIGSRVFSEPVVTLNDVRLRGLGVTGGSMDVVLNVYNPNEFALDATQLRYQVQVDSLPFADGLLDSRFTVQSNDSSAVTIPVNFSYAGIGQAARQAIQTGVVNYRVFGDIRVGTPIGSFSVPYDRTGRFTTFGSGRD